MCFIPLNVLSFNGKGCHLLVKANIGGYGFNLLIDSGATLSFFDIERVKKVYPNSPIKKYNHFCTGIGATEIDAWEVRVEEIVLNDLVINSRDVILIDFTSLNYAYARFDMPRIDGVIGGDILWEYRARIDYKNKYLELQLPKSPANR